MSFRKNGAVPVVKLNDDDLEASQNAYIMGPHLSRNIRHEFASKVFSLVALMFTFTAISCCSLTYLASTQAYDLKPLSFALLAIGLVGTLSFFFCMYCTGLSKSSGGINFIMGLITLTESCILSGLGIMYGAQQWSDIVYYAFGGATLITIALAVFAKQTTYDVTGMGMWVSVGFGALIFVGFVQMILSLMGFKLNWFHIAVSFAAILVVCFSMVYDMQLIFGGDDKQHEYSVDDYGLAAISVYLSIVILVMRIMEILARLRQR